jgi:hypothetical protein
VQLQIGSETLNVDVVDSEQTVSKHTGKPVVTLGIEFSAPGRFDQRIKDILKTAQREGAMSIDESGRSIRWAVKSGGYSYSNDGPRTYEWTLIEQEQLDVDSLVVGDLVLNPYAYKEEFDEDDILTVRARVIMDADGVEQFESMLRADGHLEVRRPGISEQPRLMRVREDLWSDKDGVQKHELVLVDQPSHDHQPAELLGPLHRLGASNTWQRSLISQQGARLQGLIDVLTAKGILSAEDVESIDVGKEDREWAIQRRFRKVRDIDEWEL